MTNNQIFFLQKLEGLAEFGQEQGGRLSRDQVAAYFDQDEAALKQMELICEYLFGKQVLVEGYQPKTVTKTTQKRPLETSEASFISQYEEELRELKQMTKEELQLLAKQAPEDEAAAARLSESMLPTVYELAKPYFQGKVLAQDLIQEANLAMILAIGELKEEIEDPYEEICRKVNLGMEALVAEEDNTNLEGRKLADKLNQLVEAITKLKEEMQVDISVEELADFLDMTTEEIEDLLRIAGELSDD